MKFLDYGGLKLYDDLLKKYLDKKINDYTGEETPDKIRFITDTDEVTISVKGIGIIEVASADEIKYIDTAKDEWSSVTLKTTSSDSIIIYNANNLTALDISNNQITDIEFLYELPNLLELKVYNNKLDMLLLDKLTNLAELHIYGNPFVDDCLTGSFTFTDGVSSTVDTTSDSYKKLKFIIDQIPSRANRGLGSIVLYPWYGLETLIYKADGLHHTTPAQDWSTPSDAENSSLVNEGMLCKFPRRIRFDKPISDTVTEGREQEETVSYTYTKTNTGNTNQISIPNSNSMDLFTILSVQVNSDLYTYGAVNAGVPKRYTYGRGPGAYNHNIYVNFTNNELQKNDIIIFTYKKQGHYCRSKGTKWYFTDEPLSSAIRSYATYTNTSIEPTVNYPRNMSFEGTEGFILNTTLCSNDHALDNYYGLEFYNNGDSILYALVEGYQGVKAYDPSGVISGSSAEYNDYPGFEKDWTLRYVTYHIDWEADSQTGVLNFSTPIENEHVLTRYNKLRKQLESDTTFSKNFVFGSAVIDSEDKDGCIQHWNQTGCNRIWETAEKGFRAKIGIIDAINAAAPDYDHYNIVRYELADTLLPSTPLPLTSTSVRGDSVHGDCCLANIATRGWECVQYQSNMPDTSGQIITKGLKKFGTSPNAIEYLTGVNGTDICLMSFAVLFAQHFSYCSLETSSYLVGGVDNNVMNAAIRNHVWGLFGEQNICMQAAGNDGRATYPWTWYDYTQLPSGYSSFRLPAPYTELKKIMQGQTTNMSDFRTNLLRNPSCYFGQAIDVSDNMTPYNTPYQINVKDNPYMLMTTAGYPTPSPSATGLSTTAAGISTRGYIGGYSHIPRLSPTNWNINHFNGTSSATPYACGTMSLALTLYLAMFSSYERFSFSLSSLEENTTDSITRFSGYLPSISSNYVTSPDDVLIRSEGYDVPHSNRNYSTIDGYSYEDGGYGMYSVFAKYVRDHWMYRGNKGQENQYRGIGTVCFNLEEPLKYEDNPTPISIVNQSSLVVGNKYKLQDNPDVKFVHTVGLPTNAVKRGCNTGYNSLQYCFFQYSGSKDDFYRDYYINTKDGYLVPIRALKNKATYAIGRVQAYGNDMVSLRGGSSHINRVSGMTTNPRSYNYKSLLLSASIRALKEPSESIPLIYNQSTDELRVDSRFLKNGDTRRFTHQLVINLNKDKLDPVAGLDTFTTNICNILSRTNNNIRYSLAFNFAPSNSPAIEVLNSVIYLDNQWRRDRATGTQSVGSGIIQRGFTQLFDFKRDTTYVITTVFTGTHIETYVNGEYMFNLEPISGNEFWLSDFITYLKPTPHNKLKENRIYDRVLSEDEIISNTIYFLNKEEYNL